MVDAAGFGCGAHGRTDLAGGLKDGFLFQGLTVVFHTIRFLSSGFKIKNARQTLRLRLYR